MLSSGSACQLGRSASGARRGAGLQASPALGAAARHARHAKLATQIAIRGAANPLAERSVRARAATDDDGAESASGGGHWYDRPCGPESLEVSSVQELVDVLATDRLVIVDFFAPWCGACRALFPKLSKLLHEYPDVLLVKVNFEANRAMCKSLGIKVLPFFHFYHGSLGRVAAFSATVSKLQRLKEALDTHSGAICSLEEPPGLEEFPDVHAEHPDDATLLTRDGWAVNNQATVPANAS